MNHEDRINAWAEQTERLQRVVYKLSGAAGIDISELIEDGYLEEGDMD